MRNLLLSQVVAPILAVICAFLVSVLFVVIIGENPVQVAISLWEGIADDRDCRVHRRCGFGG